MTPRSGVPPCSVFRCSALRFSDGRQFEELMYMLHKGHGGITATLAGLGFVDPVSLGNRLAANSELDNQL